MTLPHAALEFFPIFRGHFGRFTAFYFSAAPCRVPS